MNSYGFHVQPGTATSNEPKYEKWTGANNGPTAENTTDDSLPTGVISETDQITEYGGFYVARYEAGLATTINQTTADSTTRNVTGTPLSQKNAVPWNYIDYTNSKANAESMYNENSYVSSGLVTGTMWDTILRWLENSGVNVQTDSGAWGNYSPVEVTGITEYSSDDGASWNTATTKPVNTIGLLKTGNTDYTKRNNLYDISGNLWEWTNEIYTTNRVTRGGSYHNLVTSFPSDFRLNSGLVLTYDRFGFRVVLYLK